MPKGQPESIIEGPSKYSDQRTIHRSRTTNPTENQGYTQMLWKGIGRVTLVTNAVMTDIQ